MADAQQSASTGDVSMGLRERALKARRFAARYRGEAARVLIEIAEEFDARAARLETPAG